MKEAIAAKFVLFYAVTFYSNTGFNNMHFKEMVAAHLQKLENEQVIAERLKVATESATNSDAML